MKTPNLPRTFLKHYPHKPNCRHSLRLSNHLSFHFSAFPRRKIVSQKKWWLLRVVWAGAVLELSVPWAPTSLWSFENHEAQGARNRHLQSSIKQTLILLTQRGCLSLSLQNLPLLHSSPVLPSTAIICTPLFPFHAPAFLWFSLCLFAIHGKVKNNQKQMQKKSLNKDKFAAGSLNYNWKQEQSHTHVLPSVCPLQADNWNYLDRKR